MNRFIGFLLLFAGFFYSNSCVRTKSAIIVCDTTQVSAPVSHGIQKLKEQLSGKGYAVHLTEEISEDAAADLYIFAGLSGQDGEASDQLTRLNKKMPEGFEGLTLQKGTFNESPMVVVCGSDANGLMYGLLDIARSIQLSERNNDLLALLEDVQEEAMLVERSISTYTMHRGWFERRLYDEVYLERYFDQLAQSRINNFAIIFGYENGGFLAPPYPYFFDTPGYPDVKMANITAEQQKKNVAAFNRMIELAHNRGITITTGIWDHIYRGGVQHGGRKDEVDGSEARVSGVDGDNLLDYNYSAFKKFLEVFPEIDRIQFRMHPESGLTREEMPGFWHSIFKLIAERNPGMPVDIRAKQLPDEIINDGIEQGLKIRVTTKYWMEQMGLPFHPTHVNRRNMMDRRHGYADLLRYPQKYQVHWRLWNGGTTRILHWGDPEYMRRIAQSALLYNGNSIEFNEPLATKMESQPHDEKPFELLGKAYQYYDYEFERYWYFFDVFGRMTYGGKPPENMWKAEFARRFGGEAGSALREGIHLGSQILPRIVGSAYNYGYFPTTRGWAEKMHFGNLERFSNGGGTDIQQFVSFREQALNMITGADDPRLSVFDNSEWFAYMGDSILNVVAHAEKEYENHGGDGEFVSTVTDLKILANLSLYYAHRIKAAVYYNIFKETGNIISLDNALQLEDEAIRAWGQIVEATGDVYAKDLKMGTCRYNLCGSWATDLQQLKEEFLQLKQKREEVATIDPSQNLEIRHIPVRKLSPGESLNIRAQLVSGNNISKVKCVMKNGTEDYTFIEMTSEDGQIYNAVVPAGEDNQTISYYIEATDASMNKAVFPKQGSTSPIMVKITDDRKGPVAMSEPVHSANFGKPISVKAKVNDPSGVKWVKLRYRHLTQYEDYKTVVMKENSKTGSYIAKIPGSFITPEWDIIYFIETMDKMGNGSQYPDFNIEAPYVVVKLNRNSVAEN